MRVCVEWEGVVLDPCVETELKEVWVEDTKHTRYNRSGKGKARYDRYRGSVKGIRARLNETHRKRDKRGSRTP